MKRVDPRKALKRERWWPGDCGCRLDRVYEVDDPTVVETTAAVLCDVHAPLRGAGLEALHDAIDGEVQHRAGLHRWLQEQVPSLTEDDPQGGGKRDKSGAVMWVWHGEGAERRLGVDIDPKLLSRQDKVRIAEQVVTRQAERKAAREAAKRSG